MVIVPRLLSPTQISAWGICLSPGHLHLGCTKLNLPFLGAVPSPVLTLYQLPGRAWGVTLNTCFSQTLIHPNTKHHYFCLLTVPGTHVFHQFLCLYVGWDHPIAISWIILTTPIGFPVSQRTTYTMPQQCASQQGMVKYSRSHLCWPPQRYGLVEM